MRTRRGVVRERGEGGAMRAIRRAGGVVALTVAGFVAAGGAHAQDLAQYDYENLSFRGMSLEAGYLWSDKVENTEIYGIEFDLGFLGPGFRLTSGVSYWESNMKASELDRFGVRLTNLIQEQGGTVPPGGFDLGSVTREDVAVTLDGHYVWAIPAKFFFYTGLGVSGHFLNGSGPGIDDTFVEDLLDSVSAGVNLHAGLEYALFDRFRLTGSSKVEVLGDLRYFELRFGGSFLWGTLVSGEVR